MVVVAHHPDDLGAQPSRDWLDDRLQPDVGVALASIREIAGEDNRLWPCPGCFDLGHDGFEIRAAVDGPVERVATRQQVGVTEMKDEMVGPRKLRRITGHTSLDHPNMATR